MVVILVVVVVAVVHPFLPLGTQGIYEEPPSDSVARQPFNLDPCFATFSCFVQNSSFWGLLRCSSPSGPLRTPIQCLTLNIFIKVLPKHRHFLTSICNITNFSPVALYSSVLLTALKRLTHVTLRKYRLTNVGNLFAIWVVTFHVSHPSCSADLS